MWLLKFISLLRQKVYRVLERIVGRYPSFRFLHETKDTQVPITFEMWMRQKVWGINAGPYWPVHPSSLVVGWGNILTGVETSPGYMPGCYIQGIGKIYIGDYTQIGPQVGLISANHLTSDNRKHAVSTIRIGAYCWIGMGVVVLPGVTLGDFTTVGAGSVVTKSFQDGYCVIVGNPAREIKRLDPAECVRHKSTYEYHGYIPKSEFAEFCQKRLQVRVEDLFGLRDKTD